MAAAPELRAGLGSCNNGKLPPLPKTFRVGESQTVHPGQMRRDRYQFVGRVVLLRAAAQGVEKLLVAALGRGGHVLDVGEHAARAEAVEHLAVERALAVGHEVVD